MSQERSLVTMATQNLADLLAGAACVPNPLALAVVAITLDTRQSPTGNKPSVRGRLVEVGTAAAVVGSAIAIPADAPRQANAEDLSQPVGTVEQHTGESRSLEASLATLGLAIDGQAKLWQEEIPNGEIAEEIPLDGEEAILTEGGKGEEEIVEEPSIEPTPTPTPTPEPTPSSSTRPNELVSRNCEEEPSLRSLEGRTATAIQFENNTPQTVQIFWKNYNGESILYLDRFLPYTSVRQETFNGHAFTIRDQGGQCLAAFVAEATPATAIIRPNPADILSGRIRLIENLSPAVPRTTSEQQRIYRMEEEASIRWSNEVIKAIYETGDRELIDLALKFARTPFETNEREIRNIFLRPSFDWSEASRKPNIVYRPVVYHIYQSTIEPNRIRSGFTSRYDALREIDPRSPRAILSFEHAVRENFFFDRHLAGISNEAFNPAELERIFSENANHLYVRGFAESLWQTMESYERRFYNAVQPGQDARPFAGLYPTWKDIQVSNESSEIKRSRWEEVVRREFAGQLQVFFPR